MKYYLSILLFVIVLSCEEEPNQLSEAHKSQIQRLIENVDKFPHNPTFRCDLAEYYLSVGENKKGREFIEKAYLLDSLSFGLNLRCSKLFLGNGLVKESLFHIGKCLKIDSTQTEPLLVIGENYIVLGKYNKAFLYINRALRRDQFQPRGYLLKGLCYKYIGDTLLALSSFRTTVELDPNNYKAYNELGLLSTLKKDTTGIKYYENSLNCGVKNEEGLFGLAWSLQVFGKIDKSKSRYLQFLHFNEKDTAALYNLSLLYLSKGELDSGIHYLNEVIAVDSMHCRSYKDLIDCYEITGNEKGIKRLRNSVRVQKCYGIH